MKRIGVSSRGSLVLAAIAVAAVAVWAVAAHHPCHQGRSPATASIGESIAATPATVQPIPASGAGSEGSTGAASAKGICPPCPECPGTTGTPVASPAAAPASVGPGRAGMVVAIDPETGLLGAPTAEQAASLLPKALNPANEMQGLETIHHADGSVSVKDLAGRFRQWEVVRVGPDGERQASCIRGTGEAVAAVRDTATRVVNALEVK